MDALANNRLIWGLQSVSFDVASRHALRQGRHQGPAGRSCSHHCCKYTAPGSRSPNDRPVCRTLHPTLDVCCPLPGRQQGGVPGPPPALKSDYLGFKSQLYHFTSCVILGRLIYLSVSVLSVKWEGSTSPPHRNEMTQSM